jgi:hypothetical protein
MVQLGQHIEVGSQYCLTVKQSPSKRSNAGSTPAIETKAKDCPGTL